MMAEPIDSAAAVRPTQRLKWRLGAAVDPVPLLVAPLWAFGLLAVMAVPFASDAGWRQERQHARLPIARAVPASSTPTTEVIRIRLRSDPDGRLTQMTIGNRGLGADDAAFERLRHDVLFVLSQTLDPLPSEQILEIDADFELEYRYVSRVVEQCTGQIDPNTGQLVRLVEHVQFAPPRQPRGTSSAR